ncbi:MAG: DUF2027 domain-containing protein [Bacteroidales bacterium]|nr:DUF2027 domain-containing protein [Bacteroidales bacterium]
MEHRQFKVGDKVKFLNRIGGGIITKIISPTLVNVEEDGFEIPTLSTEIILDYVDDKAGKFFTSQKTQPEEIQEQRETETYEDVRVEKLYLSRLGQQMEKGIYLAYVPKDQQWILTGGFDIYLVNNTDYTALYSINLQDDEGGFVGEDFGSLDEKEKVHLATVQAGEVDRWTQGAIQILFHKDTNNRVLMPVNYRLKVRSAKFYKEGCFEHNGLFSEKALVLPVALLPEIENFMIQDEKKIIEKVKIEKQDVRPQQEKKVVSFFDKHLVNRVEAEVDLHIEELTDNEQGMQPFDKLSMQMDYFEKCLNEAISRNLDKIVFIHGVGQGVLKKKIEDELSKYSFLHFFPASMQKYGVGATEVLIGKNRK